MSTPHSQAQGGQRRSTATIILIGCGILLAIGFLLLAAAGGLGFWAWKKVEKIRDTVAEDATLAQEQMKALRELDELYPPAVGEDLATADLTADQVTGYLAVGRAVTTEAAELARAKARLDQLQNVDARKDGAPSIRQAMKAPFALMRAETAATGALVSALRTAGLGPTDFYRLAAIIEWRYRRRPEMMFLGLEPNDSLRLEMVRAQLRSLEALEQPGAKAALEIVRRVAGDDMEDPREQAEPLEQELAALEARAQASVALSAAMTAVLEGMAAELEGSGPDLAPLVSHVGDVVMAWGSGGDTGWEDIEDLGLDEYGDVPAGQPDEPGADGIEL